MSYLLSGAVLISFAPVLVRLLPLSSAVLGFYRMVFGLFTLLLISTLRRQSLWISRRSGLLALIAGFFFAVDILCWQSSITLIGPGLATLLANCQIFFVLLIGWLFLHESPSWQTLVAIPLAFTGLVLIIGPTWQGVTGQQVGVLLGGLAALSYALYLLVLRQAEKLQITVPGQTYSPVTLWSTLGSLVILLPMALWDKQALLISSARIWFLLVLYGVLIQGLAWLLISTGLARIPVAQGSLILLIQTALALVWDVLFFARSLSIREALGALFTIGAIWLGATPPRKVYSPLKLATND